MEKPYADRATDTKVSSNMTININIGSHPQPTKTRGVCVHKSLQKTSESDSSEGTLKGLACIETADSKVTTNTDGVQPNRIGKSDILGYNNQV